MIFIQKLSRSHPRSSFDCGNNELNFYFREIVSQDVRNLLAQCFVAVDSESKEVVGFYTLTVHSVDVADVPELKRGRYKSLPFVLLGRLGVDVSAQNKGIGSLLVLDAINRTSENELNPMGIFVGLKHVGLKNFYQKFNFRTMGDKSKTMFLVFRKKNQLP